MDSTRYSPSVVISVLLHGSDVLEEEIDIAAGLDRMPEPARGVLQLFAQGFSVQSAMTLLGVRANATRYQDQIVRQLTDIVNGETNGEDRAD